ncbi:MAG: bifunctional diaminohydroxyphosphoribosylaminopyrimidine deaminase/5-amino-6-(5-phosphoribosylamino)uracil reductase RibD [Lachnospiraceae bacterium]|nr:bifunctional diaminohydroxyphosphoribosylaminopyrimidine deaminase/5-amino-6-(5-phosphoribosylamino)uracil reductase RibD [Lachnospiraceae bacterium]
MTDNEYMLRAVELAKRGIGAVNPNPLVGAVITRDDQILAEGWHERCGELHAERNAIKNFYANHPGDNLRGATIFVTLEPCCHYGKTPPCTEAIIENGFGKVVIGSADPNPLVAGKGIQMLRDAGIEVVTNVMKEACDALNYVFFHYIHSKTPYVVMKYAMTLDGKIATYTGKSKWITGEKAREQVHKDRNRYTGIMVGVGTVIADNPMLDCRLPRGGRNPVRIIADTNLRTPFYSRIVSTAKEIPTIIATACTDSERQELYLEKKCKVIEVPSASHGQGIDLKALMEKLGGQGIDSILLEGGSTLNYSALKSGIVNRIQAYIAPKLFGGSGAKSPVGGMGFAEVADCINLKNTHISMFDEDILIESEVER